MMSKEISRNVALVTYGNLFLQDRGEEFDFEKLVTDNCYSLDFVTPPVEGIAGSSKVLASDTIKWYKYLKSQGAKKLKLFCKKSENTDLPDHISAAFVGGGSWWIIEVQFDSTSDLYLSGWVPPDTVGDGRGKTHYLLFNHDMKHLDDISLSVSEAREKLHTILRELAEFSRKFKHVEHWANNFESASDVLDEFEPTADDEFIPTGIYPKEVRQLIEAVFASWVFGGMGSWNDMAHMAMSADNHKSHAQLSEELYSAMCDAVVSAVNN
ncbi:MAG: hypothetical protein RTU63_00235 [Candidatus Thorarchaeota archaeon]